MSKEYALPNPFDGLDNNNPIFKAAVEEIKKATIPVKVIIVPDKPKSKPKGPRK